MQMKNIEIIFYSFIQGISEFLPISSSAHLYVIESFLKWEIEGLTFALAAHLGTLLAVLFFEKKTVYSILKNFFINKKKDKQFLLLFICVLPVIIVGSLIIIFFKDHYHFGVTTIALSSIAGALLLDFSDKRKNIYKKKEILSLKDAIFIGIFQVLSLIPGMSRSGTVITGARFLGFTRTFAIKLALLTSIPVISLASCYGLYSVLASSQKIHFEFFYITSITFLCAFFSIKFLLKWIKHFSFRIFVIYRICLGILLIILINLKL